LIASVDSKEEIRQSSTGRDYASVVLEDDTGKIKVMVFGNDIQKILDFLEVIYFSNLKKYLFHSFI